MAGWVPLHVSLFCAKKIFKSFTFQGGLVGGCDKSENFHIFLFFDLCL